MGIGNEEAAWGPGQGHRSEQGGCREDGSSAKTGRGTGSRAGEGAPGGRASLAEGTDTCKDVAAVCALGSPEQQAGEAAEGGRGRVVLDFTGLPGRTEEPGLEGLVA